MSNGRTFFYKVTLKELSHLMIIITMYAVLILGDTTKSYAESSSKFTQRINLSHSHYDLIGILKSSVQTDNELKSINAFSVGHTLFKYDAGLYFSGALHGERWLYRTHFEKRFWGDWRFNTFYQFETQDIGVRVHGKIKNLNFNVGYETYNNQIFTGASYPITDNILWYVQGRNDFESDIYNAHTGLSIHFVTGKPYYKENKGKSVRFLD